MQLKKINIFADLCSKTIWHIENEFVSSLTKHGFLVLTSCARAVRVFAQHQWPVVSQDD